MTKMSNFIRIAQDVLDIQSITFLLATVLSTCIKHTNIVLLGVFSSRLSIEEPRARKFVIIVVPF